MGFARYYTVNGNLDPEKFKNYSMDCKLVCDYITKQYGHEIAGFDGTGDSLFSESEVCFNGQGDDDSHETFLLTTGTTGFQFTKTQLKPYDKHVYACLVIAQHYFDNIEVNGDGEEDDYPELTTIIKSIIRDRKINHLIDSKK